MRKILLSLFMISGCMVGSNGTAGDDGSTGDDQPVVDAPPQSRVCSLPETTADAGDLAAATQKEYFATAGQVQVTAVGGNGLPVSVTLTNATFHEIDATSKAPVTSGCAASVSRAKLDGTIVAVTGGGGGGGGACPA